MKAREEYHRLIHLLESTMPTGQKLEDIMKEAVRFFESLREDFPKANKEEREEMIHMMAQIHAKLKEVSQKAAQASGMTEEEIAAYAEDPANFTPEQWREMQDSRQKLADSARKFSASITHDKDSKEIENQEVKKPHKKSPTTARRTKRKDWTKS